MTYKFKEYNCKIKQAQSTLPPPVNAALDQLDLVLRIDDNTIYNTEYWSLAEQTY